MKKIVVFGGSGGLGKLLQDEVGKRYEDKEYLYLSSKDVNILKNDEIEDMFHENPQIEQVINLVGLNIDSVIHKLDTKTIKKMVDVNIIGTLNILKESINHFRYNNIEGNIILTSSILSTNPIFGTGLYSASKAFIDNIIKTCSIENSKYKIRCNSIQLGYFDGGMTYTINEEMREKLKETIPLKRYGTGEELYNTIKFLNNNNYITGQTIRISGGL